MHRRFIRIGFMKAAILNTGATWEHRHTFRGGRRRLGTYQVLAGCVLLSSPIHTPYFILRTLYPILGTGYS